MKYKVLELLKKVISYDTYIIYSKYTYNKLMCVICLCLVNYIDKITNELNIQVVT